MASIERLTQQPRYHRQWHLHKSDGKRLGIDAAGAWQLTCGSKEVKVVVFDTGVDLRHPNLSPNLELEAARDFDHSLEEGVGLKDEEIAALRADAAAEEERARRDVQAAAAMTRGLMEAHAPFKGLSQAPQPKPVHPPTSRARIYNPHDAHGTASAGIVAAAANGTGCVGIAPECRIVPVRISSNVEFKSLIATLNYAGEAGSVILMPRSLPSVDRDPWGTAGDGAGSPKEPGHHDARHGDADGGGAPAPAKKKEALFDAQEFWMALRDKAGQEFWRALDGKSDEELSAILHAAIVEVAERVPVVCASGNNGTSSLIYPARLEQTIAVGACNEKGWRATYSQYGRGLDVVAPSNDVPIRDRTIKRVSQEMLAPGELPSVFKVDRLGELAIETTDNLGPFGYNPDPPGDYCEADGDYGFGGTSASAAQVAEVVALMLSVNPKLKPVQIKAILRETSSRERLYPSPRPASRPTNGRRRSSAPAWSTRPAPWRQRAPGAGRTRRRLTTHTGPSWRAPARIVRRGRAELPICCPSSAAGPAWPGRPCSSRPGISDAAPDFHARSPSSPPDARVISR